MVQLLSWPWTLTTKSYERAGYIRVADTLAALAAKIGLDPKALEQTVQEHNEHARTGVDPYFQRGDSAFNRTLGDPSVGKVNPNLGPIRIGPFVALRIVPATLGTATGLATDTHCGCSTSGASRSMGFAHAATARLPPCGEYIPALASRSAWDSDRVPHVKFIREMRHVARHQPFSAE